MDGVWIGSVGMALVGQEGVGLEKPFHAKAMVKSRCKGDPQFDILYLVDNEHLLKCLLYDSIAYGAIVLNCARQRGDAIRVIISNNHGNNCLLEQYDLG